MFPLFYQEILKTWNKYFSSSISIPAIITSQFLWFKKISQLIENVPILRNFQ